MNNEAPLNITVTDVMGRTIIQHNVRNAFTEIVSHEINLSPLKKGAYLIHVVLGEEKRTIKINKI